MVASLNRIFLAATCLILLVPHVQAQPQAQALFDAAAASWSEPTRATISMIGLRVKDAPLSAPGNPTDSFFEVRGDVVRVATDLAELLVDAAVVASPLPPTLPVLGSQGVHTNESLYTHATVTGTASRASRGLFVFPLSGEAIRVQGDCGAAQPSDLQQWAAVMQVNRSRPDIPANTSRALELSPCAGNELTLNGSFQVVIWEWDSHLTADEGEADLWSGKAKQETAPGPAGSLDPRPYASRAQQVFLTVNDGSFSIRGNDARPPLLYVNDLTMDGATSIVLTQASGHVQDITAPLSGSRIEMSGHMNLDLARTSSGIAVNVQSGMEKLDVDGQAIALKTITSQPAGGEFPRWALLGLVGAVLAAPAIIVPRVLYRRREARLAEGEVEEMADKVEDLMQTMRYAQALPMSLRLVNRAPRNVRAHFLRATALRRMGSIKQALEHHERARSLALIAGMNGASCAEMDLETARAAMDMARTVPRHRRARWEKLALAHLQQAAAADQAILADLDVHPDLAEIYWDRSATITL